MNRTIKTAIILLLITPALFSEGGLNPDDAGLTSVISALASKSRAYAANEAYRESGKITEDAAMAEFGSVLTGKLNALGNNKFGQKTSQGWEIKNQYSFAAKPELSFSQLLPSYGKLTGSISDSIGGSGAGSSTAPAIPADLSLSNELQLNLSYSQPLYFDNPYGASLLKVANTRAVTETNYLKNKNNLVISAVQDYYNFVKIRYQAEQISIRLNTNTENLKRIEKEFQLGLKTTSQLNSAVAAKLQAEADLLKAEQNLISAVELITAFYGELDISSSTEGASALLFFEAADPQALLEELAENPDIRMAAIGIESAEANLRITRAKSAMILTAGGSFSLNSGISSETHADNLSFSLGLSAPILDGGSAEAQIKLGESELARLQNEIEDVKIRKNSELKLYLNNIKLGMKLLEIYSLQEETGRMNYEKGLKEFELGGISQKDLLDLQLNLEDVRLNLMINRLDTNVSILKLYALLGRDLETRLSTPAEIQD